MTLCNLLPRGGAIFKMSDFVRLITLPFAFVYDTILSIIKFAWTIIWPNHRRSKLIFVDYHFDNNYPIKSIK